MKRLLRAVLLAGCMATGFGMPATVEAAEGPLLGPWVTTAPTGAEMPSMPTPRINVASAVVAGHLVVLGGQTAPGNENIVGTVEVYRSTLAPGPAAKNVWQTDTSLGGIHQPMPAPRTGASAAVVPDPFDNNRRYVVVVGGLGPDVFDENENGNTTELISSTLVQVYDFGARTWTVDKARKGLGGWGAALVRVPEPFTDLNNDREWNVGEPFTDRNGNGTFDVEFHLLNGVCSVAPEGCGFPGNNRYEIYEPGRRDNPSTPGDDSTADNWYLSLQGSPPPEREPAGVLTRSLVAEDTNPRFIYKLGGGTGGISATRTVFRREVDSTSAPWQEMKVMPAERSGHVAAVLEGIGSANHAIQYPAVFGGGNGTGLVDTILIYQPDLNGWIVDSTMSVGGQSRPRGSRFALGTIGNDIYITGGLGPDGVDGSMIRSTMNKTNTPPPPPVENPILGTWENVEANIPTSRTRFAYAQIGSKVYIFGGADGVINNQYFEDSFSDTVEVFDMATNTWDINHTPMPVNHTKGVGAALVDSSGKTRIFITGGAVDADKNDNFTGPNDKLYNDTLYIYDPEAKTWSTGTPMPTARHYPGFFVYNNRLHVVGGVGLGGTVVGVHEVYDPITNSWSTDPSGAPFGGRQGGAMTVADHGVNGVWAYWLGGSTNTTQTAQSARLNLTLQSAWQPIPNIPVGGVSGGRSLTVVDGPDAIPVFIGGDFGPVACAYDKVFHYYSEFYSDPAVANSWVTDLPMEVPGEGVVVRSNFAIGLYNGYVYVIGGDAGPCDLVNRVLRAQVLTSAVNDVASVGEARLLGDGALVNVTVPHFVTLKPLSETGFIYAQAPDRSSGIRIEGADPLPEIGSAITLSGRMATTVNGERVIRDATIAVTGSGFPKPLSVGTRNIGGAGFESLSGEALSSGLTNEGLLVRAFGKVTYVDFIDASFWLDDGWGIDAGRMDGTTGIKIIKTEYYPFMGDYIGVVGVVTSELRDGKKVRVLRGREGANPDPSYMDIELLGQ